MTEEDKGENITVLTACHMKTCLLIICFDIIGASPTITCYVDIFIVAKIVTFDMVFVFGILL